MGKDKAGDSSADRDARTQNEDRRHVARGWPAAATRAARCGAPRAKQREESERLTGGPGVGFLFSFLFFSLGCDKWARQELKVPAIHAGDPPEKWKSFLSQQLQFH